MYFTDIVQIKKDECCEKCSSFMYDLPCRVNSDLVAELVKLFGVDKDELNGINKLFNSRGFLRIKKNENSKVEFKSNSRNLKLCTPKEDLSLKIELENILINWISNTLNITIERNING